MTNNPDRTACRSGATAARWRERVVAAVFTAGLTGQALALPLSIEQLLRLPLERLLELKVARQTGAGDPLRRGPRSGAVADEGGGHDA